MRYYAETLNPKNCKAFPARRCSDWKSYENHKCDDGSINYLGIETDPTIHGNFYVKISAKKYYDGKQFYDWLIDRIGDRVGSVFGLGLLGAPLR